MIAARLALGFLGLTAAAWVSQPLFEHVSRLQAHLGSGNWRVESGQQAFNEALKRAYPDPSRVHVAFAAGSSIAISTGEDASESLQNLGTIAIGPGAVLSRAKSAPDLVARYKALLADSLVFVGETEPKVQDRSVDSLVAWLSAGKGEGFPFPSEQVLKDANARISLLPPEHPLPAAFEKFRTWSNPYQPRPLFVTSHPAPQVWTGLNRETSIFGTRGARCAGKVSSLRTDTQAIAADVHVYSRFLPVSIRRLWLDDGFVSWARSQSSDRLRRHFRGEEGMALLLQDLWLSLDDMVLACVPPSSKTVISNWMMESGCCELKCNELDISWRLYPVDVSWIPDAPIDAKGSCSGQAVFLGIAADRGPVPIATVSARLD